MFDYTMRIPGLNTNVPCKERIRMICKLPDMTNCIPSYPYDSGADTALELLTLVMLLANSGEKGKDEKNMESKQTEKSNEERAFDGLQNEFYHVSKSANGEGGTIDEAILRLKAELEENEKALAAANAEAEEYKAKMRKLCMMVNKEWPGLIPAIVAMDHEAPTKSVKTISGMDIYLTGYEDARHDAIDEAHKLLEYIANEVRYEETRSCASEHDKGWLHALLECVERITGNKPKLENGKYVF